MTADSNPREAKTHLKSTSVFSQIFPPKPSFTEKDLLSLAGKTIVITGATSGIGLALAKTVYANGADVHITGRSLAGIDSAVNEVKSSKTIHQEGTISGFILDLADLASVRNSAAEFLQTTQRLDVLIHNAGVMKPPKGSKTKLNHDLEMGTNCLGPYLLNHLLEPILIKTAALADPNSVRIIWLASMIAIGTPKGGIRMDAKSHEPLVLSNPMENYMQSKVGNVFLASETAKRLGGAGIISLELSQSVHPGLLKTKLNRHAPVIQQRIMGTLLKAPSYGVYTELFAAFSQTITAECNGGFIVPWGRLSGIPAHIESGLRAEEDGGTGLAATFVEWCKREVAPYI